MGIVAEDVARVRAATDFVAVAGEHLALKRVGRQWVGLCPFHAEKSPSFSVNSEQGLYYCFGCGAGGDAITFLREVEHLDFVEAVERLAAKAGLTVRYDDSAASGDRLRRATLVEAMAKAVDWYHERLLSSPDAGAARAYLRGERGYGADVVRQYRLGWAPDGWDALCRALHLSDDVLADTGLGFINAAGRRQDSFRARVLFPIFDTRGDPVAFGGRSLPGATAPQKYKNSAETPLYKKSRELYGLNWAKKAVVDAGEVVVAEGFTDVIGLHQSGVPQAVATCGTALTEDHVRVLRNFARRLVLAYDADAAGQSAAARVYEWERRHDLDVAVAAFPPGLDPADLARRDPVALRAAVTGARPFLAFRLGRVLDKADLRTPEGRARAAEAALVVVAEHPSELVRDQYLMEVANRTQIEPDRLRERLRRSATSGATSAGAATAATAGRPMLPSRGALPPRPEVEALRLAVHRPDEVAHRLDEVLFADPMAIATYRALASSATLHQAIEEAEPAVADLLRRLAAKPDEGTEVADVAARLATEAGARALAVLQAEARGSEDPLAYRPANEWLKLTMEELREPVTAPDATSRLVRWLIERSRGSG